MGKAAVGDVAAVALVLAIGLASALADAIALGVFAAVLGAGFEPPPHAANASAARQLARTHRTTESPD